MERLSDVLTSDCRCLQSGETILWGKTFDCWYLDLSNWFLVTFVGKQDDLAALSHIILFK